MPGNVFDVCRLGGVGDACKLEENEDRARSKATNSNIVGRESSVVTIRDRPAKRMRALGSRDDACVQNLRGVRVLHAAHEQKYR